MRRPVPAAVGVAATCLAVAAVPACATSDPAGPVTGATAVVVEITDVGCPPSPASVTAGSVTFTLTNRDAGMVTEAELMRGDIVMGEKENLAPGLSGSFSLRLTAGKYAMVCPNAGRERWDFTVTGGGAEASVAPSVRAALHQATAGYQQYVIGEVATLAAAAKRFDDAVRAGDLSHARALFAPARFPYEEIEPVAESFGDLDPRIDARADDVQADPSTWTGFHRLEKAIWADRSLAGMAAIADQLDADIAKLAALVATTTYQPAQLANGATELLNEVATGKITGAEDRYSHTDLSDFKANVDGARKAYDLLAPALNQLDPSRTTTIGPRFDDVTAALEPYLRPDGSYVDYTTVGVGQRRVLSDKVNALAEPLSRVAAEVIG
ncbi:MAG: iron uptake system component EfeO [Micromonosporaceae bacterium]|nr:iron uptake system component EfeO [Micromonosporaceae bacterium]